MYIFPSRLPCPLTHPRTAIEANAVAPDSIILYSDSFHVDCCCDPCCCCLLRSESSPSKSGTGLCGVGTPPGDRSWRPYHARAGRNLRCRMRAGAARCAMGLMGARGFGMHFRILHMGRGRGWPSRSRAIDRSGKPERRKKKGVKGFQEAKCSPRGDDGMDACCCGLFYGFCMQVGHVSWCNHLHLFKVGETMVAKRSLHSLA